MKAALDTNVLAYAEGLDDLQRQARAREIVDRAAAGSLVMPVQVVGELFNVLVRKGGIARSEARRIAGLWIARTQLAPTTAEITDWAMNLATEHRLSIWEAVIMAAAASAGCDLLLSEDLHAGFRWRGVTVVDPFALPMSPLLDAFLDQGHG